MPIPASQLVSVSTGVLSPGGTGLTFAGMFLTQNTNVPIGAPTSFANLTAVGNYFGTTSTEYSAAQVYFQGFDGSTRDATKPRLATTVVPRRRTCTLSDLNVPSSAGFVDAYVRR